MATLLGRMGLRKAAKAVAWNAEAVGGVKFYSASSESWSATSTYETIKVDVVGAKKNVALVQLHRPKALNALSHKLLTEVGQAVTAFDQDDSISAIVITGNEKIFTAGADIKEMQNSRTFADCVKQNHTAEWEPISSCSKPVVAVVNGISLGGGVLLAMMCDIVYAGDKAKFGLPEVIVGVIPGVGGTQRLARFVGKSKAMELVLSGNTIDAYEAEKMGLVSKVYPADKVLEEGVKLCEKIGSHSPLIVRLAKDAVNQAYETALSAGLAYEQKISWGTFATKDRKEGMTAFIEKRPPNFTNE